MNYSTTNSSGTSSVAPGVGHFLLFPSPHGRGFVAFCTLLKLIPTYIPRWGGSGFTLTGALVHNVMAELDPEGLEARNLQKRKKKPKGNFTSEGPLWVVSLDGHDKLCGFQNSTFILGVYGCIDTFSRKVLFLNVCYSNSNPLLIGRMYIKYLFDTEMLQVNLRMYRGTETSKLATIHVYLLNQHGPMDDPTDSIIYSPSTRNKIERWWRDLHERLEAFFKEQLTVLLRRREYDPLNSTDRQILA